MPSFQQASKQRPVIAVIGSTGVGKSQLAVSLAQSLSRPLSPDKVSGQQGRICNDAVILSADSMQLYKGLDVITNKVTLAEQGGIEHWGLGIVTPGKEASWELGKWCSEADKKVSLNYVQQLIRLGDLTDVS